MKDAQAAQTHIGPPKEKQICRLPHKDQGNNIQHIQQNGTHNIGIQYQRQGKQQRRKYSHHGALNRIFPKLPLRLKKFQR